MYGLIKLIKSSNFIEKISPGDIYLDKGHTVFNIIIYDYYNIHNYIIIMNYAYYVVGIILVIFILYYLYLWITRRTQIINLSIAKPTLILSEDQIDNPDSTLYTFSAWIYVNTLDISASIIAYGNNKLHIDKTNELIYDISSNNTSERVVITNNFPLQQWIYVVISVNGMVYEFYLDGKLVKTIQNKITLFPDTKEIILGDNTKNSVADIRIANFKRVDKSLTYYEIAANYENQKYIKDYYKTAKYNLEISLKNGDETEKSYSLFTSDKTHFSNYKKQQYANLS
jgi:hypothetical protein